MREIHIIKNGSLFFPVVVSEKTRYIFQNYFGYRDKTQLIKDVKHTIWFLGYDYLYTIVTN